MGGVLSSEKDCKGGEVEVGDVSEKCVVCWKVEELEWVKGKGVNGGGGECGVVLMVVVSDEMWWLV